MKCEACILYSGAGVDSIDCLIDELHSIYVCMLFLYLMQ